LNLNPNQITFITLTMAFISFIILLLLPSLIELKKPEDAGPRKISEVPITTELVLEKLLNVEHSFFAFEDSEKPFQMEGLLASLPNIEL